MEREEIGMDNAQRRIESLERRLKGMRTDMVMAVGLMPMTTLFLQRFEMMGRDPLWPILVAAIVAMLFFLLASAARDRSEFRRLSREAREQLTSSIPGIDSRP
jgi:hypothetical protein